MKPLTITATKHSPEIFLDAEEGIIRFTGKSRPEDATLFYTPVIKWIKAYVSNPQPVTTVVFDLDYFNSSSAKMLKTFFADFKRIQDSGKEVIIEWHYQEEDEDMQDVGEELASLYELTFSFIPYNP